MALEAAWGKRYPAIVPMWKRALQQLIPCFAFPPELRRMIYTTDEIERPNGYIKRRADVVGMLLNEAAIRRLVGAFLMGRPTKGPCNAPDT